METSEYKDCKEAWKAVEETPEYKDYFETKPECKTWEEVEKALDEAYEAMEATPEYKDYMEAEKVLKATPEWKTKDAAWDAYWEAKKKYEETVTRYLV